MQIDVSVNAPSAGRITELLAAEEDTVTVGQDLFRFEPGAADEAAPQEQKSSEEVKDKTEPADQQVDKKTPPPPSPTPEEVRKKDPAGVQEGKEKKEVKETSKPKKEDKKDKSKVRSIHFPITNRTLHNLDLYYRLLVHLSPPPPEYRSNR